MAFIQRLSITVEPSEYYMPSGPPMQAMRITVESDGKRLSVDRRVARDHLYSMFDVMWETAKREFEAALKE
jgi:hypothetical protein